MSTSRRSRCDPPPEPRSTRVPLRAPRGSGWSADYPAVPRRMHETAPESAISQRHTACSLTDRTAARFQGVREQEGVMSATATIHGFLRRAEVPYRVVPHPPAFTAQDEAAA